MSATDMQIAAVAPDAEMAVLGAMLLDPEALAVARATVTEEDFYRDAHRLIFAAACDLADYHGEAVDLVTVTEELRRRKQLDDVGSSAYLAALVEASHTSANLAHHAGIVARMAHARRVADAAKILYHKAVECAEDWQGWYEGVKIAMEDTAPASGQHLCRDVGDVIRDVVGSYDGDRPQRFTETPWPSLSRLLCGGLIPGELCYIGARPRVGKSAMSLEWARWLAQHKGDRVMIVSREMSLVALGRRMLAQAGAVIASALRRGRLTTEQRDRIRSVAASLVGLPIIMASGLETVAAIDRVLSGQRQRPSTVMIDYLQLLSGRGKDTRARIEGISKDLKNLAVKYDVPVICLSSLRRPQGDQRDRPPTISDLKESSNLDHDADVILLLHRPESKEGVLSAKGICTVAKARDAEMGIIPMEFDPLYLRYFELTEREPGSAASAAGGGHGLESVAESRGAARPGVTI